MKEEIPGKPHQLNKEEKSGYSDGGSTKKRTQTCQSRRTVLRGSLGCECLPLTSLGTVTNNAVKQTNNAVKQDIIFWLNRCYNIKNIQSWFSSWQFPLISFEIAVIASLKQNTILVLGALAHCSNEPNWGLYEVCF